MGKVIFLLTVSSGWKRITKSRFSGSLSPQSQVRVNRVRVRVRVRWLSLAAESGLD